MSSFDDPSENLDPEGDQPGAYASEAGFGQGRSGQDVEENISDIAEGLSASDFTKAMSEQRQEEMAEKSGEIGEDEGEGESRFQPTAERVRRHSPDKVNERIDMLIKARLHELADRLDAIDQRLKQIDHEWDIERTLEANAAIASLVTLGLGMRWRGFHMISAAIAGFLLQHAVQGWCPPVSIFRRMGVRTMKEIDRERYALKALRGDFRNVGPDGDSDQRADAAMSAADYGGAR